jgi:hypothetical protein
MSPPSLGGRRESYQLSEDRVGKTLIEGVGNYLIVLHPRLGNYVIVNNGRDAGLGEPLA